MKEERLVPKRRFKEFKNDKAWEQRRLGEVAKFSKGRGYSKNDLTEEGTPIILYGSLYTNYQTVINEVNTFTVDKVNSVYSLGNEVVVPSSGESAEDIARASAIVNKGIILGGDLNIIHSNSNIDPIFLALLISNGERKIELAKKAQGKSVVHLYNTDLEEVNLIYPTREEQTRISDFFSSLDNLITLHQRKLKKLKDTKSAYLSEMFPKEGEKYPKRRFSGFTDPWEQRKLGEVANYRNGKAHENDISDYGKYIVVNSKFVSTDGEVRKYSEKQIEPLYKDEITFVLSDVPNGRAIARTFLIDEDNKYTLNQRIAGITPHEDVIPYFLYVLMNRNRYFLQFDDGAKQTNLSVNDVMEFEEAYPCFEEQQKIGTLFKKLDNLITLHQRKLEKLENIKKAYLNEMFI